MAARSKLEELRQAVLGNQRGREVEVAPDGQVVLNPEGNQNPEAHSDQETQQPKVSKMSPHTFGL